MQKYLLSNKPKERSNPLIFPRMSLQAMDPKGSDITAAHSFISTAERSFGPGCLATRDCKFCSIVGESKPNFGSLLCTCFKSYLVACHYQAALIQSVA